MEYDVVIWRGILSDGSICYAAICPAIARAHGQGDTEQEALSDVADTMAGYLERMPGRIKHGQAAQDDMAELLSELIAEGVTPWVCQVAPRSSLVGV